jgi:hypothetical protein
VKDPTANLPIPEHQKIGNICDAAEAEIKELMRVTGKPISAAQYEEIMTRAMKAAFSQMSTH